MTYTIHQAKTHFSKLVREAMKVLESTSDLWISAMTAMIHHNLLVTRNTKDFYPKNPWVRIPYKQ